MEQGAILLSNSSDTLLMFNCVIAHMSWAFQVDEIAKTTIVTDINTIDRIMSNVNKNVSVLIFSE